MKNFNSWLKENIDTGKNKELDKPLSNEAKTYFKSGKLS